MNKAESLGLTEGIHLSHNESVPRWAAALMSSRFLDTCMNKSNVTYAESTGSYTKTTVLENSTTNSTLPRNQVITDKGVFTLQQSLDTLEAGIMYLLRLENHTVIGAYPANGTFTRLSVIDCGSQITCTDGNTTFTVSLPADAAYYLDGTTSPREQAINALETASSIVLYRKKDESEYVYAAVYSPIYSKPEISGLSVSTSDSPGSITFSNKPVIKNGLRITASDILADDVVYEVSDLWGFQSLIRVLDSRVQGVLDEILPSKISPKTITVNNIQYQLGRDFDSSMLNSTGAISAGDSVKVLLGYDGSVVHMSFETSIDSSSYALVLHAFSTVSTQAENTGENQYYATLLTGNSSRKTVRVMSDLTHLKNKPVTFEITGTTDDGEYEMARITTLECEFPRQHTSDRVEKTIDGNSVADDVVIFNLLRNISGSESAAYIMDWSVFLHGDIEPGRIKYMATAGSFEDINVIFTENILYEGISLGVVTGVTSSKSWGAGRQYKCTVLVEGKEYEVTTSLSSIGTGTVLKLDMFSGTPAVKGYCNVWDSKKVVEAVNSTRIRIGGRTYRFSEGACVYIKKNNGTYETIKTDAIETGKSYDSVSLYLDRSLQYGGRVELIIIS